RRGSMQVNFQPSGDKILCVTLSLIIAFSNSPAFAQQKQVDFAELDKVALEELKQRNTPGAAVAVIKDGQVIYAKGYGVASIETGAPVTPDMLFRLGSTTKMLTPYAALEAATRVPAEFLHALGEAGVIERGKRADLVLLELNPLEDISTQR